MKAQKFTRANNKELSELSVTVENACKEASAFVPPVAVFTRHRELLELKQKLSPRR